MSLREYLRLLRRGKWWIAAGLLVGALGGYAFAVTSVPTYVATTTLYFAAIEGGGEPGQVYQGALLAEQKARAYSQLIVTDRILDEVAFDTGAPVAPSAITVQSATGDPTLIVKVTDPSPQRAALVVNTLAEKVADLAAELERPNDPLLSTVTTVRILAPADAPTEPTSPNLGVDVAAGAAIGVLLGLAGAVVRRNLDQSVPDPAGLGEVTGLPVLGSVPYDGASGDGAKLLPALPSGQLSEAVRQLRVNLRSAGVGADTDNGKTLLVTSARPGEGATSVACQLAAAFGLEGDRVLLVDADLRDPSVGRHLGIAPEVGLGTVLRGECAPNDAVQTWGDGLFDVVVSGQVPDHPGDVLGATEAVFAEYARHYDTVLVVSPAVLVASDTSAVARSGPSVLLVARRGGTPGPAVADAVAALRLVSARLVGCVLVTWPRRRPRWRANRPAIGGTAPALGGTAPAIGGTAPAHHRPRHRTEAPAAPASPVSPVTPELPSDAAVVEPPRDGRVPSSDNA